MNKKILIILLITVIITSFSSCSSNSKTVTPAVIESTKSESPVTVVQDNTIKNIVETQKTYGDFIMPKPGIRPVAVMVDNQGSRVLPQGGLDKAQVIYEIIVEGGITRLMPVFWGTVPEMIGPVRSSRHYFLDYVMENDAIYVHYGFSPQARKDISKFGINNKRKCFKA